MTRTEPCSWLQRLIRITILSFSLLSFAAAQDCEAAFEVVPYNGPEPVLGGYTLINQSTGNYTNFTWDFGDGTFNSTDQDSVTHYYATGGYTTAQLYIWGDGCFSTAEVLFFVTLGGPPCDYTDCVLPGDANHNGLADYYDVLHIGIGYGQTGPTRPDASTDWIPQAAPDWNYSTPDGVNGKHIDCNGDGVINEFDLQPVIVNNTPINSEAAIYETDQPTLYLHFPEDTIYVTTGSTYEIELEAELRFGSQTVPVNQVAGIASRLNMLPDLSSFVTEVNFDYDDNSFFGSGNAIMSAPALRHDAQVDLAVAHIDNNNASGYGTLGTVSFIIISDIVEGRSEGQVSFPISVHGIRATNAAGEEKTISVLFNPESVLFIANSSTGTKTPGTDNRLTLFPNPVRNLIHYRVEGAQIGRVSILNSIGQELLSADAGFVSNAGTTDIATLDPGVYFIKIQTEREVITRAFQKF